MEHCSCAVFRGRLILDNVYKEYRVNAVDELENVILCEKLFGFRLLKKECMCLEVETMKIRHLTN